MPWWGWLVVSSALAAWLWRISFRVMANDLRCGNEPLDGDDFAMAFCFATVGFVVIGPIALLCGAFKRVTGSPDWNAVAWKLAGETRDQKRRRREQELREREDRVARLERELGIGQS